MSEVTHTQQISHKRPKTGKEDQEADSLLVQTLRQTLMEGQRTEMAY